MALHLYPWLIRSGSSLGLLHPRQNMFDWPWALAQASLPTLAGHPPPLSPEGRTACENALCAAENDLRMNPDNVTTHQARIMALKDLRRFEEALVACGQIKGLAPKESARMLLLRGQLLFFLARDDEAQATYRQALALHPNDAQILLAEGVACWRLGHLPEALAVFERAIEICPQDGYTYLHKGELLPYMRRFGEALAACDRAIELDPMQARALYAQGIALTGLGWYPEAFHAWERAKHLDPTLAGADYARGCVLWALQRTQEAYAAFKRACALDPSLAPPAPQWTWCWEKQRTPQRYHSDQGRVAPPSRLH